jgi:hypothetical protein
MNIKFSHKYPKIMTEQNTVCDMAKLIEVININLENLSEHFLKYDTADGLFKLPKKGEYMMLIFLKDGDTPNDNLFTTLRRRTPDKEKYYRSSIGTWFDIEIVEA